METSSDKTVLFVTDGDVGNDAELVARSSGGVRISTVGIGSTSRAGVLESMAKTSGGLCTLIPDQSTLEEALRNLHQRLGRPHWMGLSVNGVEVGSQAPRYWDVWEGVPATFFGKASALGEEVTVEGWLASSGQHAQTVKVLRRDDLVIHRSWARARLLDLDDLWSVGRADQSEMVALSVEAQVLCRFTAFTAIDSSEVVANREEMRTVVQPVEPTLAAPAPALSQAAPIMMRCKAPPSPPRSAPPSSPSEMADCFSAPDHAMFSEVPASPRCESLVNLEAPSGKRSFQPSRDQQKLEKHDSTPRNDRSKKLQDMWGSKLVRKDAGERQRSVEIWSVILDYLKRWTELSTSEDKAAILTRMTEALGAHTRGLGAGSTEEVQAKDVMSLLIDLQQALEDGEDETRPLASLTAVLEAFDAGA